MFHIQLELIIFHKKLRRAMQIDEMEGIITVQVRNGLIKIS
uniref:Uncharacterized protein n=1 Tax=Rhizophora mucronata TaxID=61149 RepID=A0A2P2QQI0_RHIMU